MNVEVQFSIEEWLFDPHIVVLKHFLTDEECNHLISLGQNRVAPSTTVDPDTGETILVADRSSSGAYLALNQDPVVARIEERLAALVGLPVENGEGLQLLNYQVGQCYKPHFDFFDPNLKGSPIVLANGGQRVSTCIMYLNTVEEGGETHFPEIDFKVKPIKGDALLFFNISPNGEVDRKTLHASLPVLVGEKWAATKWTRERKYE